MTNMADSSNQKPFLIERRPLMLKDYLLDDASSCSSNGFKSFPRRQCCTTVRLLLEKDIRQRNVKSQSQRNLKQRRSEAVTSTKLSAFQRASEAVINAVKLLPFPSSSVKSPSPSVPSRGKRGLFLPRSFSRRLFKKSRFWRKSGSSTSSRKEVEKEESSHEIKRWRLFREFLEDKDKTSDQVTITTTTTTTTTTITTTTTSRLSTSSSSNSNSNSNSDSWGESEFTGVSGNDAAERDKDLLPLSDEKEVNSTVSRTDGEDSITYSTESAKEWPIEGKEQFSPVSVLDCPFKDEEEITSPVVHRSIIHLEGGTKNKVHKSRRFENLAQMEPVDLEKRIAMAELHDESVESSKLPCPMTTQNKENMLEEVEGAKEELLNIVKSTLIPSDPFTFMVDSLLLDLFEEKNVEHNETGNINQQRKATEQALEMVQNWLSGNPQEMFLGWEVKDNRHVYVKDMEKNGSWKNPDEEKVEMALELESEIFSSLVNELFNVAGRNFLSESIC